MLHITDGTGVYWASHLVKRQDN